MQYILTEEEYIKLKTISDNKTRLHNMNKKDLETFCKKVANTMPVHGWHTTDNKPEPWECIHSEETDEWYCDDCPCTKICPMDKEWSK